MKKALIFIFLMAWFTGCEEVLDKRELNAIDGQDIWNDMTLANLYLNNIYGSALPTFSGTESTNISDESVGTGTGNMMYGMLTKTESYGNFTSNKWYIIRELNLLINGVPKGNLSEEDKDLLMGQAYFLRAWTYWELVKYYGGVPLILKVLDPAKIDDYLVGRNSAHECIAQIIEDLDMAIDLLPSTWPEERGRVTRAAAAALKGRVLLFYASPQFNPDNLGQRWQSAYDANLEAKNICEEDGHALYGNYARIFLDEASTKEAIFFTIYDAVNKPNGYETSVRPRSVSNTKDAVSSAPNWDFVKSYPMADGLPAKDHPEYDSIFFWKNRDPRFYATIAYNGMKWDFEGTENRVQWTYHGNTVEPTTTARGATTTGFYLKKNINTSIPVTETPYGSTDWIEIRLAEVYLNLAECAVELGIINEAKDLLILIRDRAGIEPGDGSYGITASTREEMLEAVMLERKIELAFENKRHWDLRRRNMYINDLYNTPKINGSKRHGMIVELDTAYICSLDPGLRDKKDSVFLHFEEVIMDTIDLDTDYETFFNTNYNVELDEFEINFLQPKYNFYYIPEDEMEKNIKMQQTIYWTEVNPFDPLAE
ncbi:MAG: RagB/SusD family nutrient uptake outer membrane protein [Bacteroidales bacterium]|nr:RagB/SusD family nutrient uptake outer membrane protein [Bacteroidales bacterium]